MKPGPSAGDDHAERKAQTSALFNAIVADYDVGPGCFRYFGQRLVRAAGLAPGQTVLDVACGRGAVLFPAAEKIGRSGNVIGIDLADDMVHAAKEEAARQGLEVKLRAMDGEHLDFPDATFDRVLCGFGVMFFPDQDRALGEFRRVLKPGGQIGVSTWRVDQASELKAVMSELGMAPPRQPGWISEPDELSRLLMRARFTNVQVEEDSHLFRYANIEEYWRQARGTGFRRVLDGLQADQADRVRAALAERLRPHHRSDGFYVPATALLARANR